MAGVRKAANSHSSLHCCGCSCSLSGHIYYGAELICKSEFIEQITRAHFYTPFGVVHYARNLALPLGELSAQPTERGKHDHTKGQQSAGKRSRLRSEMTPNERKLWYLFLRKYPVKVYKQRIIGRFIVDFYCASAKLVIELDGSQHYEPQGMAYDSERSAFLTALGLEVLRFSNRDVDMDFRSVCTRIDITIQKRL
jgi:very-short-patch-repair endonuclease